MTGRAVESLPAVNGVRGACGQPSGTRTTAHQPLLASVVSATARMNICCVGAAAATRVFGFPRHSSVTWPAATTASSRMRNAGLVTAAPAIAASQPGRCTLPTITV